MCCASFSAAVGRWISSEARYPVLRASALSSHHFLVPGAVLGLAGRMAKPAGPALLIETPSTLERDPACVARAGARAVAVPTGTDPAQEEQLLAVRSDASDQPQRVHALPPSGPGGWTTTTGCAKKRAATRALPRRDAARGS